jgi:DNA invertase Pin-like site-specific DNA recombinase
MPIKRRITALYCRLSKDDDLLGESVSIKTQKLILEKYAVEHGYYNYEFYVDDGYSGVTFDRPDFQKMIKDVEFGKIERIIVKDLSRFGRNYIHIGEYVEITFPKYEVQFISISENMDSELGNMDMLPFNNLMNEWYARDISKKQKASVRAKGTNGKRLTSKPIYGYISAPHNHSEWIIDEKAAEVVRQIFEMYISGSGLNNISKHLAKNKILTPSAYDGHDCKEPYS